MSVDGHCVSCGSGLDARLDWCSLCLTPVRRGPAAAAFRPGLTAARGTQAERYAGRSTVVAPPPPPPPPPPPTTATGSWSSRPAPGTPAPSFYRPVSPAAPMTMVDESAGAARTARRRSVALALAVIGLNLVVQFCVQVFVGTLSAGAAVGIALAVGLAFYAGNYWLVRRGAAWCGTRPLRGSGRLPLDVGCGVAAGGITAAVVLTLQYVTLHRVIGDVSVAVLASRLSALHVLTVTVLMVVAAPVVEEYTFRGVLLESWRNRSRRSALLVSALLFAVAHLRPAAIIYYTLCGLVLGRVYWRRGLAGSMAAHATFNGALVVAALLAVAHIDARPTRVDAGGYSVPTADAPTGGARSAAPASSAGGSGPSLLPAPLPDPSAAPVTAAASNPSVVVDPAEARTVAAALWTGRNLAYHDRNPQALADYESGDILAADEITCTEGCPRPAVYPAADVAVDVPRQTAWPATFLATVGYTAGCFTRYTPCNDTFVAQQTGPGQAWKIVLLASWSGHVYAGDPGVDPASFAPAASAPAAARTGTLTAEYAAYLSALKQTGDPPVPTRLAPGPFTTDLGPSLHQPLAEGVTESVTYRPAASPPYEFSTSHGTTAVCGQVTYTAVKHAAGGAALVQPQDRSAFDSSLAPGVYGEVVTQGVHDVCFEVRDADPTAPVMVFASWGGPMQSMGRPAG